MTDATPKQVATAHTLVLEGRNGVDLRLPEPWVFDGVRRVYRDGRTEGWIARAVNLTDAVANGYGSKVALQTAEGVTPLDATVYLVMKLEEQE